jgi:hypothetical protein
MSSEDDQDTAARAIMSSTRLLLDCEWPTTTEEQAVMEQQSDNSLNLNEIREAAKENGYEEWYYCERYGVIQVAGFRKWEQGGDVVKVQVYPKTHAVSVCYIHNDQEESSEHTIHTDGRLKELLSTKTKSLFVAPNVNSVDTVREILADPLVYGTDFMYTRRDNLKEQWTRSVPTSVKESCAHCQKAATSEKSLCVCSHCKSVAYCNRQCQRADWKLHKQQCVDCRQLDVARRFHHVAVVSGLTTDPDELEHIVCTCELFDSLLFEPDGPPCMCRSRHACGSICALSNMLLEIGRQHHDVIGIASQEYAMLRFTGQVEPEENYQASFPPCLFHDGFMDQFGSYMERLEEHILSLNPDIRSELLQWLFERIRCEQKIVMINSKELPLTKMQMTFPIHFANMDYSRLVFGEDAQQALCFVHGTFNRSSLHEEDDDDDDDSAAGTEATAQESEDEDEDEVEEEHGNDF